MDPEEERIKLLTRLGRETVIKRGTYEMDKAKTIIQDHPFYKRPEESDDTTVEDTAVDYGEPSEMDAAALASQIIGNNFKSGLSQEEVDALLNGMM